MNIRVFLLISGLYIHNLEISQINEEHPVTLPKMLWNLFKKKNMKKNY